MLDSKLSRAVTSGGAWGVTEGRAAQRWVLGAEQVWSFTSAPSRGHQPSLCFILTVTCATRGFIYMSTFVSNGNKIELTSAKTSREARWRGAVKTKAFERLLSWSPYLLTSGGDF